MGRTGFKVAARTSPEDNSARRYPKVEIEDEDLFIAVKLAKEGYYGGNVEAILSAPVDVVQALLDYEVFESEYEREFIALNKPDN